MIKNSYWSPYLSGILIGITLLAAFYIMGFGLGASSPFSLVAAVITDKINPEVASSLEYFQPYLKRQSPFKDWLTFELAGLFVGAFVSSLLSRKFRLTFDRGKGTGYLLRFIMAFIGGIIIGFSSRLARGCTSGVALSGGAQLAVSGWIFVISMFVSGFFMAKLLKRFWR